MRCATIWHCMGRASAAAWGGEARLGQHLIERRTRCGSSARPAATSSRAAARSSSPSHSPAGSRPLSPTRFRARPWHPTQLDMPMARVTVVQGDTIADIRLRLAEQSFAEVPNLSAGRSQTRSVEAVGVYKFRWWPCPQSWCRARLHSLPCALLWLPARVVAVPAWRPQGRAVAAVQQWEDSRASSISRAAAN